jgi:Uma2 family endonuclease
MREDPIVQTIDYADLTRLSNTLDAEKPYVELIDGVELPKASPMTHHGQLQLRLGGILQAWAAERGVVGTEWRFWLVPIGDRRTSLVPDVAYASTERLVPLSDEAYEIPPFAPDVAIEVRSPSDRAGNIRRKIELYLAHGAHLVLDVDPAKRRIVAHDATSTQSFADGDRFEHAATPGLTFDLRALFDSVKRRD